MHRDGAARSEPPRRSRCSSRGAQQAADEHGVTFLESDIDRDGGKIILVAGAPQTDGEDEERMLRTRARHRRRRPAAPVHIGVSRGRVFPGRSGPTFRRTYTDPRRHGRTRRAADGEGEARGEMLTTRGRARARRSAFEATELEPLAAQGQVEPQPAIVLGDHSVRGAEAGAGRRGARSCRSSAASGSAPCSRAAVAPVRMGFGTMVELDRRARDRQVAARRRAPRATARDMRS